MNRARGLPLGTRPACALGGSAVPRVLCFVAGLAGFGLTAAAALAGSTAAWQSYILALVFWTGLSLGALALALIHGMTGGRWGEAVRAELDAATRALPLLALLFVLALLGLDRIFPWAGAEIPGAVVRDGQRWYLNVPFFVTRAMLYFSLWLALLALGASRRRGTSAAGLIVLALTASLAAVDWIGSLMPQFYSTGFGLMVATGEALAALALGILTVTLRSAASPERALADRGSLHDLGKLQLTLVLAFAYLALMQFVTVWVADLPREIVWYLPRLNTSWRPLTLGMVALEFAVPFVVLLSRRAKRNPALLAGVAVTILVGYLLDSIWLVAPTLRPDGFSLLWTDATALIGIGGLWLGLYVGRLERAPSVGASGGSHAPV